MIELDERSRNLDREWRERSTIDLIRLGIAGTFALGLLLTFVRRSEFGLYRALGMQRRHVLIATQAETLVVLALGSTIGVVWAAVCFLAGVEPSDRIPADEMWDALWNSAAMAAAMFIVLPAATLVSRSDIMDALKDR